MNLLSNVVGTERARDHTTQGHTDAGRWEGTPLALSESSGSLVDQVSSLCRCAGLHMHPRSP